MFTRIILLAFVFMGSAWAQQKIAIVDFQRAIDSIEEGTEARKKLDTMMKDKQAAIKGLEDKLRAAGEEYEKQQMILSDSARQAKEQELGNLQMQYQQAYAQSENEMQQVYVQLMDGLIGKLRKTAEEIGESKGYDLILEVNGGSVVYWKEAHDITGQLIQKYNSQ